MSRFVLIFTLTIAILGLACSNRGENSNLQANTGTPAPTAPTTASSPQSTPQSAKWLKYSESRYINIDLNNLVKIDFPVPTQANLFILKNNRLSPLTDGPVISADTIQRLRELVTDSARHWVRVRSGSGTSDAQDSWVNLEKVTQADFGEAQDGEVCNLTAGESYAQQVHLPAELEKTKRYIGAQ
jgi:hypothetical protein